MSAQERHGTRDLVYSHWHRRDQIKRYLEWRDACSLAMIDLDGVEYCWCCYEPLALIELARDIGQAHKNATVTRKLAGRASLPAFLVFYTPESGAEWLSGSESRTRDITGFRVRQLEPKETEFRTLTPREYALFLLRLRAAHICRFDVQKDAA